MRLITLALATPIALAPLDTCNGCNPGDSDVPTYASCTGTSSTGDADGDGTCNDLDDDDDGDGIADVDDTCFGANNGSDADGDGLCGDQDPHPNTCDSAFHPEGLAPQILQSTLESGTAANPYSFQFASDGELRLCEGTYWATIKGYDRNNARVASANGPAILRGSGDSPTVRFTTGFYELEGITLQGGGGLEVLCADTTVADLSIYDATPATGHGSRAGAIHVRSHYSCHAFEPDAGTRLLGSNVTVERARPDAIYANGAAIAVDNAELKLTDSTVRDNGHDAANGGGLYAWEARVTLDTVTFAQNAGALGGASYWMASTGDLRDVSFESNWARDAGSVAFDEGDSQISTTRAQFITNTVDPDTDAKADEDEASVIPEARSWDTRGGGMIHMLGEGSTHQHVDATFVSNTPWELQFGTTTQGLDFADETHAFVSYECADGSCTVCDGTGDDACAATPMD